MKLLTFLGVSPYRETCYTWQDQETISRFAPVATCRFLKPDRLTVFLTKEAAEQVYPDFRAGLPAGLPVDAVPVPLGKNENELWQIFDQVSAACHPGEEVAFDITNGLRSFPLVGLLAAAFLRSGLDVNVKAVVYGAYEAADRSVEPWRAPIFDLSPMLTLLEWSAAADRFNRTGDARYLGSLLKRQRKEMALAAEGNPDRMQEVGRLGNLAKALAEISQSLHLIRPFQVMEKTGLLPERIEKARPGLARAMQSRPFSLLLENVAQSFTPLGLLDPHAPDNVHAALEKQRLLLNWYVEREQWVQAITLAREWLISWTMVHLDQVNLSSRDARGRVEDVINAEADDFLVSHKKGQPFTSLFLARLPQVEVALGLWKSLGNARNDIDHAGMREDAGEPERLVKQIQGFVQTINRMPL